MKERLTMMGGRESKAGGKKKIIVRNLKGFVCGGVRRRAVPEVKSKGGKI